MNRQSSPLVTVASVSLGLLAATQAHAAAMQKVNQSDWQAGVTGLPTYVNMYIYVPDKPATKPPIVVVPHHCQGTASSSNSEMSSLNTIANSSGFIIIYPEATGQNCWDAGSSRSLKHGGGGDTGAIVQMVKYTLGKYNGDAGRVYSVGGSSGGIMTEALLGVYPDVFMGGISIMGVPCGCWASGYNDVTGTSSTSGTPQWSNACAGGNVTHTAQEWGDLVRSYYPGYTGHRPRLQHWHGTADTTLNYKNMAEDVKEWTNLLSLSATPTGTDTPKSGTTHQFWKNSCYTVYETFALSGVGHAVNVDGATIAAYFGVDKATATADPETAACGGGTGGTTSTGGASSTSAGGGSATGGRSNAGGTTSTGTTSPGGGASTGGHTGSGGSSAVAMPTGGRVSNTGGNVSNPTGGATAATGGGVANPTGGKSAVTTTSATSATGGALGVGGANPTGGAVTVNTGTSTTSSTSATGGAASVGGAAPQAGSSATATNETGKDDSGGCGCAVPGQGKTSSRTAAALLLTALGMFVRRRSARKS